MMWRWGILITLPYGLVPLVGSAVMAPSLVLWQVLSTAEYYQEILSRNLGYAVAPACVFAIVCGAVG